MVIAIIGILAALLLPALSQARERGRRVICLSNQRQLHIGAVTFAIDNDDLLPPADTGGVDPAAQIAAPTIPVNWGPNAAARVGATAGTRFDWADIYWQEYMNVKLASDNYFASDRQFGFCPSGRRKITDGTTKWGFYNIRRTRIDYSLNGLTTYNSASAANRAGYTLVRMSRFWATRSDTRGDVYFSTDSGDRNGSNTPHSTDGGLGGCQGLNVIRSDGAGLWQSTTEIGTLAWHTSFPTEIKAVPGGFRTVWYYDWNTGADDWRQRVSYPASGQHYAGGYTVEPISGIVVPDVSQ